MEKDRAQRVGELVMGAGRRLYRALPGRVRKDLEDRFFYALFQTTRVENDNYGWRPPTTESGAPQETP